MKSKEVKVLEEKNSILKKKICCLINQAKPIGSIQIHNGYNQEWFGTVEQATTWLNGILSNPVSDVQFDSVNDILYFNAPAGTESGDSFLTNTSAFIVDRLGLISTYGNYCFYVNRGNNIFNNVAFGDDCFVGSEGDNKFTGGNIYFGTDGFAESTGNNDFSKSQSVRAFDNFFAASLGNNVFDTVELSNADGSFAFTLGNNIFLGVYSDCLFKENCFRNASGSNSFLGENTHFFMDFAFSHSTGNNIFNNVSFTEKCMQSDMGINIINNLISVGGQFGNGYGAALPSLLIIKNNLGASEGQDFPSDFMAGSSGYFIVKTDKQTSDSGNMEGDVAIADGNGANVLFIL